MKNLKLRHRLLPLIIFLFGLLPFSKIAAQGNLLILPKRIVFEGPKRSGELNLTNIGKDTARYSISLIHYRMKEDGSFEEIKNEDSSLRFADRLVRFYPRSVILAPNETQSVRIQLVGSNNLAEGEYRSHLYFRAVANPTPLGESEKKKTDSSSIIIALNPVFGIAVPVIVRSGASTAKAEITDCVLQGKDTKTPTVEMTIDRSGNMSVYGDIVVEHISPDGRPTRMGFLKGIAVYTPTPSRRLKLPLSNSAGIDLSKGKIRVMYQLPENTNQAPLAQKEILLN